MSMPITEQLLNDYFAGTSTASQIESLEVWASQASNRELFLNRLAAWESQHLQCKGDVDEATNRHRQRIRDLGPG